MIQHDFVLHWGHTQPVDHGQSFICGRCSLRRGGARGCLWPTTSALSAALQNTEAAYARGKDVYLY